MLFEVLSKLIRDSKSRRETLLLPRVQNIPRFMLAIAELLRVPVPPSYQVAQLPPGPMARPPVGPDRSSLAMLANVRVPMPHVGPEPPQP